MNTFTFIKMGEICIKENSIISTTLGSCVSICLYDKLNKIGGMNHYLLPTNFKVEEENLLKYGDTSIIKLIEEMKEYGSELENLEAKIFGGASINFTKNQELKIGDKNINIAEKILTKFEIPIIAKDVYGNNGRKINFDISKNKVFVKYY